MTICNKKRFGGGRMQVMVAGRRSPQVFPVRRLPYPEGVGKAPSG